MTARIMADINVEKELSLTLAVGPFTDSLIHTQKVSHAENKHRLSAIKSECFDAKLSGNSGGFFFS